MCCVNGPVLDHLHTKFGGRGVAARRQRRASARGREPHRVRVRDQFGGGDRLCGPAGDLDDAIDLVVAKRPVCPRRELIGASFDAVAERHTVGGRRPVRVEQPPSDQPFRRVRPFIHGPSSGVQQQLDRQAGHRREQHVGLTAVEALRGQERHVAVSAVLAQRRGHLPGGLDRVIGASDLAVGGEERPTCAVRGFDARFEQGHEIPGDLLDVRHHASQGRGRRGGSGADEL